jgi:hypothetical protein
MPTISGSAMAFEPAVAIFDACILPAVNLPDPNDRHVVAAAVAAGASVIFTWNVRHFPSKALRQIDCEAGRRTRSYPRSMTRFPI